MRTIKSAKNLMSGLAITGISLLLGFVTRKVFVDNIGVEYVGLNGLLQNILGALTLLEGGFAGSIVYQMYKPLAEKDKPRIIALMQFFRKVYLYIAGGVFLMGTALYPFIGYFIKDADSLSYVSIVYFIFLFNTLIQYFTAYKWSIINADQNAYKLTKINLCYQIGLSCTKLAILYYTSNYILYLLIESAFNLALNYAVVKKANRLYPFIVIKKRIPLERQTKKNIIINVKAIFLNSLGGYFLHSTSNLVISSFLGIGVVGLYANYTMIIGVLNSVVSQIMGGTSESVAHLLATESSSKAYQVFQCLFFLNYVIVGLICMVILNTFSPFISWWLGSEYLLDDNALIFIVLYLFLNRIRATAMTFKSKSGIFIQDRFLPLWQGILNLLFALILVRCWGLNGVLAASGIAIFLTGFWRNPMLVYKLVFNLPVWKYFQILGLYCASWFMIYWISRMVLARIILSNGLYQTMVNGAVTFLLFLGITCCVFAKKNEFRALLLYFRTLLTK